MSLTVEVLSADSWAEAVAGRFAARLASAPNLRFTVPSGNTPKPVYAELVRRQLDMSHATLYLLDEFGGIPVDHPARCESMLRKDLLDPLPQPPALRTFDIGAADLDVELAAYEKAVTQPPLDLVVLGLGGNGHIGLNEPGSHIDSSTRRVDLDSATMAAAAAYGDGGAPPTWGVTMGIGTILAAREIWLLVTGSRKREILDGILEASPSPHLPATLLRTHGASTVFADDEAVR